MKSQLLKANDVAERLNISLGQAFVLLREGELPSVRFGRNVRVREEDLELFITSSLKGPSGSIINAERASGMARPVKQ